MVDIIKTLVTMKTKRTKGAIMGMEFIFLLVLNLGIAVPSTPVCHFESSILFNPPHPVLDIAFVHGPGEVATSTWTTNSGVLWPVEWLSNHLNQSARILSTGTVFFWFVWLGEWVDVLAVCWLVFFFFFWFLFVCFFFIFRFFPSSFVF